MQRWLIFSWMLSGCGSFVADALPQAPAHDDEKDGARHALGKDYPFLCPSLDDLTVGVECQPTRPTDEHLSCDAAGCHGGLDFETKGSVAVGRHLRGAEGPSCFTCHDVEWKDDTIGRIRFKGDDR